MDLEVGRECLPSNTGRASESESDSTPDLTGLGNAHTYSQEMVEKEKLNEVILLYTVSLIRSRNNITWAQFQL